MCMHTPRDTISSVSGSSRTRRCDGMAVSLVSTCAACADVVAGAGPYILLTHCNCAVQRFNRPGRVNSWGNNTGVRILRLAGEIYAVRL